MAANAQVFEVGDIVQWTSQAAGVAQRKIGRVVQVVPPSGKPEPRMAGVGMSRDHQSYVVMATVSGRDRNKRYWPRASMLRPYPEKQTECPVHGDALRSCGEHFDDKGVEQPKSTQSE